MTIHVLVEGPSESAFFEGWTPRLNVSHTIRVHPHQGKGQLPAQLDTRPDVRKRGLLDQLPAKFRGFAQSLNPSTDGILVLVDGDDDDIANLSRSISIAARTCCPHLPVRVCVAVEEMEAFYLADLAALGTAYPSFDAVKAGKYHPDSVCGTWELFGEIIGDDGGNKVAWATRMGRYVTTIPARSRSPSFREMVTGFNALAALPTSVTSKRRKYRHPAKDR